MSGFHHEAVFYADDDEYLAGLLEDISDAVDGDGAVLVAVSEAKGHLLKDALRDRVDRVAFADMERLGRNPACIIPAWREFVRDAGPGPLVGVGEPVWPGRSDAELIECRRHESLLNLAFGGLRDWRLLCPYDVGALDPAVLEDARHNHPYVVEHNVRHLSDRYEAPEAIMAWDDALPPPSRPPSELAFNHDDLALARTFITDRASSAGFARGRLSDLVLAVNELTTNSLRHGGGHGVLRTWEEDETFLCEVQDGGRIDDLLAGREQPSNLRVGGRGLWLVNHLCDLVQVRSSQAGNVVRLHMSLGSL
jgi:anti-sigma regulatory factor (Ser/Thr protein kinase)